MKQIEVKIMGQAYLLAAPEAEDARQRLLSAAQRVDAAMCRIRNAGKIRARERIAVLAALNLAYELDEPSPPPQPTPSAAKQSAALRRILTRMDRALDAAANSASGK